MKKLLVILVLALVSLNSMAMGFPQSTVSQQRTLLHKSKKVDFVQKIEQVENNLADKVEEGKQTIEEEKNSLIESLMESVGNFFIKIFATVFSSHKAVAMNETKFLNTTPVQFIESSEVVA